MIQPTPCLRCGHPMRAEHAHDRCDACGYLSHCCHGECAQPQPQLQTTEDSTNGQEKSPDPAQAGQEKVV